MIHCTWPKIESGFLCFNIKTSMCVSLYALLFVHPIASHVFTFLGPHDTKSSWVIEKKDFGELVKMLLLFIFM